MGGHVVCERPVARAAPESPSPPSSPTPSLLAEETLAILNALPGPLKVEILPPLVADGGAHPGEHTHITTHGDGDFVEVKPTPAVAPEYINGLSKSEWEEREKVWREEGIALDYRAVESEEKEDGVGREDGNEKEDGKKEDEGDEEDEDEEDEDEEDEDEEDDDEEDEDEGDEDEEDGEGKDGKETKVQERELGDCKPGSWGC